MLSWYGRLTPAESTDYTIGRRLTHSRFLERAEFWGSFRPRRAGFYSRIVRDDHRGTPFNAPDAVITPAAGACPSLLS